MAMMLQLDYKQLWMKMKPQMMKCSFQAHLGKNKVLEMAAVEVSLPPASLVHSLL